MFTTLMAAAMLSPSAPLPRDAAPTGPAPYILNLKAGTDGEIKLTVQRVEKQKVQVLQAVGGPNGAQQIQQVEQEVSVMKYDRVGLADLKDLKVYSVDGKEVAIKDAVKKANDGGIFIASANGQKVDASYLKLFKDDVLVFVSPDLVPRGGNMGYGGFPATMPGFPGAFPVPQPLPPAPPPLPVAPPIAVPGGQIQIQIAAPAIEVIPVPLPLPPEKK